MTISFVSFIYESFVSRSMFDKFFALKDSQLQLVVFPSRMSAKMGHDEEQKRLFDFI